MVDSDINNEPAGQGKQFAYAGVALLGNKTLGDAPEWHEISAWCDGALPEKRATEVLSHLANNADCFQQWLDMVEAREWLAEEALLANKPVSDGQLSGLNGHTRQPERAGVSGVISATLEQVRGLFQRPLPVYGGALAAIMLAVLVAPLMRQTQEADLRQQLDRSTDAYIDSQAGLPAGVPIKRDTRSLEGLLPRLSISDVERQTFQFGLRNAVTAIGTSQSSSWQQWIAEYPDAPVDCDNAENADHCTRVGDDINTLGHWTLLSYAACEQQGSAVLASEFWDNQLAMFDQLAATEAVAQSPLFGEPFSSISDRSAEALCGVVDQLLERGQ